MKELYQMYIEELSSVCYRYVPSRDDAKDVLQNSFVKILTSIPDFEYRDEAMFKGWMKKVVANEALGYLKDRRRLLFVEQQQADALPDDDDDAGPEQVSPDELHQLITELPDGYRMVVNLFAFEGYSHKQIAALLGICEATSASQFFHAKRLLAKKIKEIKDKRR